MELISCLKDLLTFRPLHALAQIFSLIWIIIHPHIIFKRRKLTKKIRKVSDEKMINSIIFNKSIVYEYFIKNKKEYQNLFTPYFELRTLEACYNSIKPRQGNELFLSLKNQQQLNDENRGANHFRSRRH